MIKRLILLLLSVVFIVLMLFIARNSLLQWAFKKAGERMQGRYQLALSAESVSFSGVDDIEIKNLMLLPGLGDTLLIIDALKLDLAVFQLCRGVVSFNQVQAKHIDLHVVNINGISNLPSVPKNNSHNTTIQEPAEPRYKTKAAGYYRQLMRLFDTQIALQDVHFTYRDSTSTERIFIPGFEYDRHRFSAMVIDQNTKDTIDLQGTVLQKEKTYYLKAQHRNDTNTRLPFLNKMQGLRLGFRELSCKMVIEENRQQLSLLVDASGQALTIAHWRLAEGDVTIPDAGLHALLLIKDNQVEIDSSSTIRLKSIHANVFAAYKRKASALVSCAVHMPETNADSFFRALPGGMFQTLQGISATGTLTYDLRFSMDTQQPDSLEFYSSLSNKKLQIIKFGKENYPRINAPFDYEAYNKDRFVRTIHIGPHNPTFTPLASIHPYLIKSVLQSEDPSFMLHRGFLSEAFRESIIKNYKEKRFARGGSTISMQLVKNVFLSRNKTIARKAEEALVVYLIENLRWVSKERMLEIYLNVIEWGPGVYGIGEASAFYFNKKPSELHLSECIFLAGIIPNPIYFKYQFDTSGHLKPYLSGYFQILSSRMLSKGWINEQDTTQLLSSLQLHGRAKQLVSPLDSASLLNENDRE
ncbi:MAG: transglycosylase domain-containing protein [Bacteroidetes bacterium]|nr:transglycosylase domain-containing protein [Bacteroidota bacterium]